MLQGRASVCGQHQKILFDKCFPVIRLMLVLSIFILCQKSIGQTIKSRLYDSDSGNPVEGATIIGLPDSVFAISDSGGKFSIQTSQSYLIRTLGYNNVRLMSLDSIIYLTPTIVNLKGVEVTTQYIPSTIWEYAGAISKIGRKEIGRYDPTIITPALNSVPGIYMHSGALNTNRITIRGIGARTPFSTSKIRAYFEDIPLTTGIGETTLEDIDLDIIQNIEVIKGPTSSLYGVGLGGSILLNGIDNSTSQKIKSATTFGSFGLFKQRVNAQISGSNSNVNVGYTRLTSDGYRDNNEFDRDALFFLGTFGKKSDKLNTIVYYVDQKAFIPSALNFEDFNNEPTSAAFSWQQAQGFEDYDKMLLGISWKHDYHNSLKQYTSIFTSFRNAFEPRPFNILKENSAAAGLRSRLIIENSISGIKNTFMLGGEYFVDWYNWGTFENLHEEFAGMGSVLGAPLSDNRETREYFNIFFEDRIELSKRTRLSVGLNVNSTQYDLQDFFTPDSINQTSGFGFDVIWSPRIALNHEINPSLVIYSNISHGFAPPTLEETLTPEGLINTNIQPETGYNYEIGLRGIYFNKVSFDLSVYQMDIKGLLVSRRTAQDQFIGINAGKTTHRGLELAVDYAIINNRSISINYRGALSLNDFEFKEFIDGEDDFSGNQLTGVPSSQSYNEISLSTNIGVYWNTNAQYVGEIPITDANSIFSDSYFIVNTKAGFRKSFLGRFTFDISGGINNVFDERYASMLLINAVGFGGSAPRYYYPGLPRNYYGSIELGIQLN